MTTSRIAPVLALAGLLALALPAVARGAPSATGDFDGDGRSDLAIGAPTDSVAGRESAGAVNVIYGSRRGGLREDSDQQFTQVEPRHAAPVDRSVAGDERGGVAVADQRVISDAWSIAHAAVAAVEKLSSVSINAGRLPRAHGEREPPVRAPTNRRRSAAARRASCI
jgi:hypothetical protein